MKIHTQISDKEYISLLMSLFFKKPIFIIFGCMGVILLICFFSGWNIEGQASTPIYYLLLALFFLFINPFIFYQSMKNQISKNPELTEKITYEFTNEQIIITGETFTSNISWENIKKIQENNKWFFIHQKHKVTNFIPKSEFTPDTDAFRQLIKNKGF